MDFKEPEEIEKENITKPAIILKLKRDSCFKPFGCSVCPCSYTQITNLKYHIRREHYNLITKITKREKRDVNDVWLERVMNSQDIIEITKTGHNKYSMKKSNNPNCLEIAEADDTVDLTPLYPDCARPRVKRVSCYICKKKVLKPNYNRHLEEQHDDLL